MLALSYSLHYLLISIKANLKKLPNSSKITSTEDPWSEIHLKTILIELTLSNNGLERASVLYNLQNV